MLRTFRTAALGAARVTLLAGLLGGALPLFAGPFDLNVIDTPKTYASSKGELHFDFTMYDQGGILTSATLGLADYFFLGVYFDVGQLIGSDEIEVEPPGVLARLRVSDGSGFLPPIALGYGYFMKGAVNKVDGVLVSGFYAVGSASFFLFKGEQSFTYGLRYPVMPFSYSKPENLSIFFGLDLDLAPAFGVKAEIENIQFTNDWWEETYYNLGFAFNVVDIVTLSLELKYSPSIDTVIRLLRIGYSTQF